MVQNNAINHPESIIRAPHLTEPELAICKALGAKWVSMDDNNKSSSLRARLWRNKPTKVHGQYWIVSGETCLALIWPEMFPSVHPGDLIEVL